MAAIAGALDRDDTLTADAAETTTTPEPIFVGHAAEVEQALAGLRVGHSLLVKGQPGLGKRALLREVRRRLSGERVCLWPTLSTPKTFVADLAEQVHQAVGLAIPERLVPPRFRAEANRTGRVEWRHIQRTLTRWFVAAPTSFSYVSGRHRPSDFPRDPARYLSHINLK